jgi:urease accessory protein
MTPAGMHAISAAGNATAALLLADARFPSGGYAHSGGLEPAATAGTVSGMSTLEAFLRGRLRTSGLAAACLAAASRARAVAAGQDAGWARLDAEADARTPSPAQREASRRQGRALLRAARAAWPGPPWLDQLAVACAPAAPHHAIVLGAAVAAAGCSSLDAALIAAYQAVTGPASAAVRLLALDPLRVSAVVAGLADQIDDVAREAARSAAGPLEDLPFPSAPALDLLAEAHARAEVRLFES